MTEHRVDQQARRRDGLHAAWEAFIVLLVCVNLALILFDSLFALQPVNTALASLMPQLHERYQQSIHVNFQYIKSVGGSHVLFAEPVSAGYFFQVPGESRVFFVLPYQGRTLVGTTEVRQGLAEPIACSEAEAAYLVKAYNAYMREPKRVEDIVASFAAVRPLIRSASDPGRASREYALERQGRLLTVYGGKWTTARALGQRVARAVAQMGKESHGVH